MSGRRLGPPPGSHVPRSARVGDADVALEPLAEEVSRRYAAEFPDEEGRHGEHWRAWCVHDTAYVLSWSALDARGVPTLDGQVRWLAGVLEARGYPPARLARSLEICAEVVDEHVTASEAMRDALRAGAGAVRESTSFDAWLSGPR